MSKRGWAAIVYGRSYHLDFRFIAIPDDFTKQDTDWALEHILATTQQARNLANHPRWSLFKNDSHCVIGVTCMVRDLAGHSSTYPREAMQRGLGGFPHKRHSTPKECKVPSGRWGVSPVQEAIAKDDRGRPLYTFVGYVTKLNSDRVLQNFPAYSEADFDRFGTLCREIVKVWWVKNYERDRIKPSKSHYQALEFSELTVSNSSQLPQFNHGSKNPAQTYLSPSSNRQNNLLWLTSAKCLQPTSTCLNIKGKALVNSPFLNQTIANLAGFQVKKRIMTTEGGEGSERLTSASTPLPLENRSQLNSSFSQKISHRAKEDLDLTLQQAAKVAIASQELINNFADWSSPTESETQVDIQTDEVESFGFKSKSSNSDEQDWF